MCVCVCVRDISSTACTSFIAQIFIENIYCFKLANTYFYNKCILLLVLLILCFLVFIQTDTPSITAKLINEQKEDKEKKNHEEKEKMKADSGFQDNYSVVVASGTCSMNTLCPLASQLSAHKPASAGHK